MLNAVSNTKSADAQKTQTEALCDVIATYKRELEFFEQRADASDAENEKLANTTYLATRQVLVNWRMDAQHEMEALDALNFAEDCVGDEDKELRDSMVEAAQSFVDWRAPKIELQGQLAYVIEWYRREVDYYNQFSRNCANAVDPFADRTYRLPYMLLRNWSRPAASAQEATEALRLGAEDPADEGLLNGLMRAVTLYLEATANASKN